MSKRRAGTVEWSAVPPTLAPLAALVLVVAGCGAPSSATLAPTAPTTPVSPSASAAAEASSSPSRSPINGPFLGDIQLSDGRHLHLACAGTGSPTVILDAGFGSGIDAWGDVFTQVADFTHVCAYDRAGVGESSGVDGTKTTGDVVEDLRELVENAEIPTPYVLVGHSIAGLHLRLMGGSHRDELAGMLFVDPSFPHQFEAWLAALPTPAADDPDWLTELRTGLASGWPPTDEAEQYDVAADIATIDAVTSFGDLPIIVLTAGIQTITPAGEPLGEDLQAVWFDGHEALAALSSDSRHDLVRGARHSIQDDRPDVVVDAIRELVDRARDD